MAPRIDLSLVNCAGIGFENRHEVPTCGPDYGEGNDIPETPITLAADMLAQILARIIPEKGRLNLALIGQKFVALNFLLNRNGTDTLTSIAERAGVSKQLLDHHAITIGREMGFHGFGQKRIGARASFSEAQRLAWSRLTPEERKARRAGKSKAQNATPDLTDKHEVKCEHTSPPPNSLGL